MTQILLLVLQALQMHCLFERFEIKLKDFSGNLQRSVVELQKSGEQTVF